MLVPIRVLWHASSQLSGEASAVPCKASHPLFISRDGKQRRSADSVLFLAGWWMDGNHGKFFFVVFHAATVGPSLGRSPPAQFDVKTLSGRDGKNEKFPNAIPPHCSC